MKLTEHTEPVELCGSSSKQSSLTSPVPPTLLIQRFCIIAVVRRWRVSEADDDRMIEAASQIVAAYVSNNSVASQDLGSLIGQVHAALCSAASAASAPEPEPQQPAVPIRKSVTPDQIVCLEDGKRFKSLKRHLRTHHDMTPDQYREKWGLSRDYPMVAPNYANARSELAKAIGLGQKGTGARVESARPAAAKSSKRSKARAS